MKIDCELSVLSDASHLQQIYTGFSLLSRRGYITLRQNFLSDDSRHLEPSSRLAANLIVTINGKTRVCYDNHDSNLIDQNILSSVDLYFKRSYDKNFIETELLQTDKHKIFPLGLNYNVESAGFDRFKVQRARFYHGRERLKMILKGIGVDTVIPQKTAIERLSMLEGFPDFLAEPKVLFMARTWDPDKVPVKTHADVIHEINMSRATCIRILRKEYGRIFFGGLARDEFSLKYFPDCILPDDKLSNKRNYLKTLRDFPICIATMGLWGSNGWKLGEYVSFSKAILTEPLRFQVPGGFQNGKNYLEFRTAEELLNAVQRLIDDKHLRTSMMINNYRYYQGFLRPDALILNTLAVILANSSLLT